MRAQHRSIFFPALFLALGIAAAGWFVGTGFERGRSADRYVTVKGISERNVEADVALWPFRFTVTADDLSTAQTTLKTHQQVILEFLDRHGVGGENAEVQRVEVNDLLADPYHQGEIRNRYIVSQTLMVRSENPEAVERASRQVGELVEAGVVLPQQWGPEGGPSYLYNGLTDIKPAMIAEATANAREAAQQFAADSGATVGAIRQANQGVFQILPRDAAPNITESSQRYKTVRVVSTIEYFLEDDDRW